MIAAETNVIRVLVADDHPPIRTGIQSMLAVSARGRPCVVEEAETTEDAVDMVTAGDYNVVLMDYSLPGIGGDKATRLILERRPETFVVGLSNYIDRLYVERMVKAGARGYIAKSIGADALYSAIRTVMAGKPYYSNEVALQWMGSAMFPRQGDPVERLTRQEKAVLQLVLSGLRDKDIAARMFLSPRTIEKHRHNGMAKLGAHNAVELVQAALRLGLNI